MKASVYNQYIERILEQSTSPCNMEEVIVKIASHIDDIPFDELRQSIKSYFRRSSDILLIPYGNETRGEKRVMLKSKFLPASSQYDVVRNVLNYRRKPMPYDMLWNIVSQFEVFQTSWSYDYTFFEEEKDKLAYFIEKVPVKELEDLNLDEDSFLIGLSEWESLYGYWKLPQKGSSIYVIKQYLNVDNAVFNHFKHYILRPYFDALEAIPFKIRTYTDALNGLIEKVFDISSLDDHNLSFYETYKECMAFIKKNKGKPKPKSNPVLGEWVNNMPKENVNIILYSMCEENIYNSAYFYRDSALRKKNKR